MSRKQKDPSAFIILNPHAAKGKGAYARDTIADCFAKQGFPCEFVMTEHTMHASEIARDAVAKGHKLIVAAGGDGTVNEVIDGVMKETRQRNFIFDQMPVVGLVPIGRGNDFGYIAKTPKSIEQACALVMDQYWMPTDCGFVKGGKFPDGRYFVNGVGLGFEPTVNFVASDFKRLSGMPSYLAAFVKVMANYPSAVRVSLDTEEDHYEFDTQQISICNGRRMGSAFIMAPEALIDDGLLDVCFANREIKGYEILWYALKFFKGTQVNSSRFTTLRATKVTVTADHDMPCHADGEEISRGCDAVQISLFPSSLKFIRKQV